MTSRLQRPSERLAAILCLLAKGWGTRCGQRCKKTTFLHEQGLTGNGQIIAVIDAGFPNVNTLPAFKRIRKQEVEVCD